MGMIMNSVYPAHKPHTVPIRSPERQQNLPYERRKKRDGQMSKQKTASVSAGLRNTEGQEDPTGAEATAKGEHTQRQRERGLLAKQQAVS